MLADDYNLLGLLLTIIRIPRVRIGRTALIVAALFILVGVVLAVSRMYLSALVWVTLAVSLLSFDPSTVLFPGRARKEGRNAPGPFQTPRNLVSMGVLTVAIVFIVVQVVSAIRV